MSLSDNLEYILPPVFIKTSDFHALLSKLNNKKINQALELSDTLHKNQKRDNDTNYSEGHIYPIAWTYLQMNNNPDDLITILLHDSLEDHPDKISSAEIKKIFGSKVLMQITALTKPPKENYLSKSERNKAYLKQILSNSYQNIRQIKVIDLLQNMHSSLAFHINDPKTKEYFEYIQSFEAIFHESHYNLEMIIKLIGSKLNENNSNTAG